MFFFEKKNLNPKGRKFLFNIFWFHNGTLYLFCVCLCRKGARGDAGTAGPKGDKVGGEMSFFLLLQVLKLFCCIIPYSPFMLALDYEHLNSWTMDPVI